MSLRSYHSRPAKAIERHILVEALGRLAAFGDLAEYQYVGFGAHEFIDFELLWRHLGIESMVSIEWNDPVDRHKFNRPYEGVDVIQGDSTTVLPNFELRPHSVVWLDYTSKLNTKMIDEMKDLVTRLGTGSVLLASFNVTPEPKLGGRRRAVERRLGVPRVPVGWSDDQFAEWGLASLCGSVLRDEVAGVARSRADGANFKQLFNFRYQDGAQMATWGGAVVGPEDAGAFAAARFDELPYVRVGEEAFTIDPPALTLREILHLNRQLPRSPGAPSPLPWFSVDEVDEYAKLHRWYPAVR